MTCVTGPAFVALSAERGSRRLRMRNREGSWSGEPWLGMGCETRHGCSRDAEELRDGAPGVSQAPDREWADRATRVPHALCGAPGPQRGSRDPGVAGTGRSAARRFCMNPASSCRRVSEEIERAT